MNYTTTDKELVSIVETLKEFRHIILGYEIEIFTDHKNLTFESTESSSQRAQCWQGLVQEFDTTLKYIKGKANKVADDISRLPKEEHETPPLEEQIELNLSELLKVSELFVADTVDQFSINVEDIDYPLAPQLVEVEQKLELNSVAGEIINTALNNPKSQWEYKDVEGAQLIHFCNRIYVPKTFCKRALKWYHH